MNELGRWMPLLILAFGGYTSCCSFLAVAWFAGIKSLRRWLLLLCFRVDDKRPNVRGHSFLLGRKLYRSDLKVNSCAAGHIIRLFFYLISNISHRQTQL